MKISIALSLLILGIGAVLGWQDHQRLAKVRMSHDRLVVETTQSGIVRDSVHTVDGSHVTKRERDRKHEGKEAEAKNAAAEFIAFVKEMDAMDKKGGQSEVGKQEKILKMMDRMMALDSVQLKILIAEVRVNQGSKNQSQEAYIGLSIRVLANNHPQAALALITESPDLLSGLMNRIVISSAMIKWAKDDPAAASEWVRANGEKFSALVDDNAKCWMIKSVANNNPKLAFKLIAELGLKDGDEVIRGIATAAKTPEERTATLAALRAHLATLPEGEMRDNASGTALPYLGQNAAKEGFEAGSKWIENAALTSEQLAQVCDFSSGVKREESGKWVEWMGAKLPVGKSKDGIHNLVRKWAEDDYQAAGRWLAGTPDGPTKNISIRSYAETVAKYEPESAAQWAMTLPPGKDREETLKNIYEKWPPNDEVAKEVFSKLHGIQ
jgi:hypothetical protein